MNVKKGHEKNDRSYFKPDNDNGIVFQYRQLIRP